MTPVPPPNDPNPLAVIFCAIAAVCVLCLCGIGLCDYVTRESTVRGCVSPAYLMDRP